MKTVSLEQADVKEWIREAQHDRLVITRGGKPVALLVGVTDVDVEQLELGSSDQFWDFIAGRRAEKTINRTQLTKMLRARDELNDNKKG